MNSLADQAAKVLAEIEAALAVCEKATAGPWKPHIPIQGRCNAMPEDFAFIAASRTGWPTTLRCLKTAIEGCLDKRSWDDSIHQMYIRQDAEEILTEIITQWNENK